MLIKCPECGADVSNRACACVKCGCPLGGDADEGSGTVIVYGLSQMNLIGGSLKIYANGVHAGTVKKHGVLEFSIRENSIITTKCGINPSKGVIEVKVGRTTKIKYDYNRITGCLVPQIVYEVVNRPAFLVWGVFWERYEVCGSCGQAEKNVYRHLARNPWREWGSVWTGRMLQRQ